MLGENIPGSKSQPHRSIVWNHSTYNCCGRQGEEQTGEHLRKGTDEWWHPDFCCEGTRGEFYRDKIFPLTCGIQCPSSHLSILRLPVLRILQKQKCIQMTSGEEDPLQKRRTISSSLVAFHRPWKRVRQLLFHLLACGSSWHLLHLLFCIWLCPWHVEVPRPEIDPTAQQSEKEEISGGNLWRFWKFKSEINHRIRYHW